MTGQKTYKTLMVLAAVAVLGFGGYWFMGTDSGVDAVAAGPIRTGGSGPEEVVPPEPPPPGRRPNAEPTGTAAVRPGNGDRDSHAATTAGRKPRARGGRVVNKVKMLPGC